MTPCKGHVFDEVTVYLSLDQSEGIDHSDLLIVTHSRYSYQGDGLENETEGRIPSNDPCKGHVFYDVSFSLFRSIRKY